MAEGRGIVHFLLYVFVLFILKKGTHLDEVLCVVLPGLVFFRAIVICYMVYFDELFLLSCY